MSVPVYMCISVIILIDHRYIFRQINYKFDIPQKYMTKKICILIIHKIAKCEDGPKTFLRMSGNLSGFDDKIKFLSLCAQFHRQTI